MNCTFGPQMQDWVNVPEMDEFTTLVRALWSRLINGAKRDAFLSRHKHLNRCGGVRGGMFLLPVNKAFKSLCMATVQLDVLFVERMKLSSLVQARCNMTNKNNSAVFMTRRLQSVGKIGAAISVV